MGGRDRNCRNVPLRSRQGIMDGPRGAGPAIAESNDGCIDAVEERIHFCIHPHPFLSGASHAAPERDLGAVGAQAFSPDLAHPIPGSPQHVNAKSDLPPGEFAYIGPTAGDVIAERGRRIENIAYGHKYTLSVPRTIGGSVPVAG